MVVWQYYKAVEVNYALGDFIVIKFSRSLAMLVMSLAALPAEAAVKDIHAEKLPQDPAIHAAYADVASLEAMARVWSSEWRYPTPKPEVAARLTASLAQFQKSLVSAPDNEELLLLTGLVAHYAYNVDVESAFQVAIECLASAQKLAPRDDRPQWFLGIHQISKAPPIHHAELLYDENGLPKEA
jgi:hypothetical protein